MAPLNADHEGVASQALQLGFFNFVFGKFVDSSSVTVHTVRTAHKLTRNHITKVDIRFEEEASLAFWTHEVHRLQENVNS